MPNAGEKENGGGGEVIIFNYWDVDLINKEQFLNVHLGWIYLSEKQNIFMVQHHVTGCLLFEGDELQRRETRKCPE